jgi:NADPH:quinone reductase-like Zn-dependent oxidoreductase
MRAIVSTPDDAQPVTLQEVGEPHVAADEVLVEVAAFSINRGELGSLARQPAGWQPGQDIAGTVARAATDGSGPPVGTRVVGLVEEFGWAERAALRTTRLAVLRDNVRFEDAAAMPIPGLTALRALRRGGFLLEKRVMVTGATGVVGTIAIQLAAQSGARVTAVARADAAAKLKAIGAEAVVEVPTDATGPFDLILEASGGDVLAGAMQRVAAGGRIVCYGNTSAQPTPFNFTAFRTAQNASIETLYHYSCEPSESAFAADLRILVGRMAAAKLAIEIAGEHDWSEMGRIVSYMQQNRFRGKYVFRVSASI